MGHHFLLVFEAVSCQTPWIQTSYYIFHIYIYLNIIKSRLYDGKHPQLFQWTEIIRQLFLVG